jgi:hypothetical protein
VVLDLEEPFDLEGPFLEVLQGPFLEGPFLEGALVAFHREAFRS